MGKSPQMVTALNLKGKHEMPPGEDNSELPEGLQTEHSVSKRVY